MDIKTLRNVIGNLPALREDPCGDNIAIALASYFDKHIAKPKNDEIDTDLSWGKWVIEKTNEALDLIVLEIYKTQKGKTYEKII